ncbi:MAG: PQQ-binding-like beta-propeller repeat protein [Thermoplasmatota archaeon]
MERSRKSQMVIAIVASMVVMSMVFFIHGILDVGVKGASTGSPQWSTFKGSPDRSGRSSYNIGENKGELIWMAKTSQLGNSSISISDNGTLYVASKYMQVYALSGEGKVQWDYLADGEIHSTPTLDSAGNIYFGCHDGCLYSLDSMGITNWKKTLDAPVTGTPVVTNDVVYIGTHSGNLYCLDHKGEVLWNYTTEGSITSSPTLYGQGRVLVTSNDRYLYCIEADGELDWRYFLGGKSDSTPAVGVEGGIFVTSDDEQLHSVNSLGSMVWRYSISDTGWASPSSYTSYQAVVGTSSGYVHRVGMYGRPEWKYSVSSRITTSLIVSNDGFVIFGTQDGHVICMDHSGSVAWKEELESTITTTPAIDRDGNVYVGDSDGRIYKLGTRPRERPSPPLNLCVETDDLSCTLDWDPPMNDGNMSIQGYSIFRREGTDEGEIYIGATGPYVTRYNDINVMDGLTYYYRVFAFNSMGDSEPSNVAMATPMTLPKVPGRIMDVIYSIDGLKVTIQWSSPSDEGTSPVTGYHLCRKNGYAQIEQDIRIGPATVYEDTVPEKDRYYYYVISAISEVGEGPGSDSIRVFVPDEDRIGGNIPTGSQDQETEEETDWVGVICCLFMFIIAVGFPIVLIIIITKALKGSGGKKKPQAKWSLGSGSGIGRPVKPPIRIDIGRGRGATVEKTSAPVPAGGLGGYDITSEGTKDREEEGGAIDVDTIPVDEEEEEDEEEGHLIEMELSSVTGEDAGSEEPPLPSFERPGVLSDEQKDEFIVERILELKEMLADGEIDQEMYQTLRKRLVDQMDDRSVPSHRWEH